MSGLGAVTRSPGANGWVYVPSKEAAAAGENPRVAVSGRPDLPASERSNARTVAVTPRGVIDHLNRKTSPMGARSAWHCHRFWLELPGVLHQFRLLLTGGVQKRCTDGWRLADVRQQ